MKKQIFVAALSFGILATGFSGRAEAHELTYKVQSGDTLWKISQANHLSVQDLMNYNHLTTSNISVGQEFTLLAPHSHTAAPESTYTVKSGDSLSLIAKNFNTTVTQFKSLNQLTSDIIKVGQVLKVPAAATAPAITNTPSGKTYTVKSGDSLSVIAKKYGVSVTDLKAANQLTSDVIRIGQQLNIPGSPSNAAPAATPAPAAQPAPVATTEVKTGFNADALIAEAKKYIGVPYVWGGNTPSGFDCSGFLKYVFNSQGVTIPRTVATIWGASKLVTAPQKGDLVFFTTISSGPSHAGIYIGDNKFIHASSSSGIMISDLNNSYWKPRYLGARSIK
ncbi:MAG: LysM peptidoglycan-binding domain-containing protein [Tuberibacillus sp.]